MARPKQTRHVGADRAIAERMAWEFQRREDWSYPVLAKMMEDVGCPIAVSSLHRILGGKQRVTADEFVGFAKILGLEDRLHELLVSVEVLEDREARAALKEIEAARDRLVRALAAAHNALNLLALLRFDDPEVFDFIRNHLASKPLPPIEVDAKPDDADRFRADFEEILDATWSKLTTLAIRTYRDGAWDDDTRVVATEPEDPLGVRLKRPEGNS